MKNSFKSKSLFTCCPQGKLQISKHLSVLGAAILKRQRKVRTVTLMITIELNETFYALFSIPYYSNSCLYSDPVSTFGLAFRILF